jgi:hypothetical protein
MTGLPNFDPVIGMSPYLSHTNGRAKPKVHPMKMRDEEGHRAMQAAGKAWKAIKTHSTKTWTEWTEVIGPGLVKAQAEARSVSNKPSGKGYNTAMGALLEEYGFGNAVERFRSKVTRADLLHCMDYLTEIEAWRHKADASVLEPVERKQNHRYPDHATLNHPTVVWRRFSASKDGKDVFKARGIEPKPRAPKPTEDEVRRDLVDTKARLEEVEQERDSALEKVRRFEAADSAAEPTAPVVTTVDLQAHLEKRVNADGPSLPSTGSPSSADPALDPRAWSMSTPQEREAFVKTVGRSEIEGALNAIESGWRLTRGLNSLNQAWKAATEPERRTFCRQYFEELNRLGWH